MKITKPTGTEVLHLNLHKKWFVMILHGIKLEEYRVKSPYWIDRFKLENGLRFNTIRFSNGYASDRPQFDCELKGIMIGRPFSVWCESHVEDTFILSLGRVCNMNDQALSLLIQL